MSATPGPWECVTKLSASENHRGYFIRAAKPANAGRGKWALAEVQPVDEDGIEGGANARLIAAAPLLLDLVVRLEAMLPRQHWRTDCPDPESVLLRDCRAVLAQVRGAAA